MWRSSLHYNSANYEQVRPKEQKVVADGEY